MKFKNLTLLILTFLILSCSQQDKYLQYFRVDNSGWGKESPVKFDFQIDDTLGLYNIYINVRNRGEYPYQNLWLFLEKITPDSIFTRDTVEFYLADNNGKWMGTGSGASYEMPVLYQQKIKFSKKGLYKYKISQGMRDSLLRGINDVGMRLEKAD